MKVVKAQSKLLSLKESLINVTSGFLISLAVWVWVIIPMFGIISSVQDNLAITGIFTVVSIIRSYVIRRIYNFIQYRQLEKEVNK